MYALCPSHLHTHIDQGSVWYVCMYVCVCVYEIKRKRERERFSVSEYEESTVSQQSHDQACSLSLPHTHTHTHTGLTGMVLSTLSHCPIDTRTPLLKNFVVVGVCV